jgi:hypothetical protein
LLFERIPLAGRLYTRNAARFPKDVKFGDIVKGLAVPWHSFRGVYCSHVLEHLSVADFRTALRNTWSYLEPGGRFRLVMPDLEGMCREYISSADEYRSFALQTGLMLRKEIPRSGLVGFMVEWLGHDKHCWLWDYGSAASELRAAGFVEVRRATFGDSEDKVFNEAEHEGRWKGSLGIECKKQ